MKAFSGPNDPPTAIVRSIRVDPIAQPLPEPGVLCLRGIVPADELFGPGNVGRGTLGLALGSANILDVTVLLQEWLDPINGTEVALGPDGIPCTDDDPGLANATVAQVPVKLALAPLCNGDANVDGQVTVDEIIGAVNNALSGCPAP